MPTSKRRVFRFKYVNGHPSNAAKGLQTVTAFGSLRGSHRYPLMLTEMTLLTALGQQQHPQWPPDIWRGRTQGDGNIGNGAQS